MKPARGWDDGLFQFPVQGINLLALYTNLREGPRNVCVFRIQLNAEKRKA
jgi:hypothetical protein